MLCHCTNSWPAVTCLVAMEGRVMCVSYVASLFPIDWDGGLISGPSFLRICPAVFKWWTIPRVTSGHFMWKRCGHHHGINWKWSISLPLTLMTLNVGQTTYTSPSRTIWGATHKMIPCHANSSEIIIYPQPDLPYTGNIHNPIVITPYVIPAPTFK